MFWILPRFWKIGVRIFQHRILIAMSKLSLQSDVTGDRVVLGFDGALRRILIARTLRHHSTSYNNFYNKEFSPLTLQVNSDNVRKVRRRKRYMKRLWLVLFVAVWSGAMAMAGSSHATLSPVKAAQQRVQRHRTHRAGRHHHRRRHGHGV